MAPSRRLGPPGLLNREVTTANGERRRNGPRARRAAHHAQRLSGLWKSLVRRRTGTVQGPGRKRRKEPRCSLR